jgi:hypothetical protein
VLYPTELREPSVDDTTRTCNLQVRNLLLYPLSYVHVEPQRGLEPRTFALPWRRSAI